MSYGGTALHTVARNARRAQGLVQARTLQPTGAAPTAVSNALKGALRGSFEPEERAWIRQIEALRRLLLVSPQPFEMVDYGAGTRSDPTHGSVTTSTRTIGAMTRYSKSPMWAKLLFRLVRALEPETVLELGSCVGISAAYLGAGLRLNGHGRLISLEGVPALAERSARTLEELGLTDVGEIRLGEFGETLPAAIDDLKPVGCAFIDGNHEETATLEYAEQVLATAAPEALLVFDDINYDDSMRRAWQTIRHDQRYALTIDLRAVGLAVVSESAASRHEAAIGYY